MARRKYVEGAQFFEWTIIEAPANSRKALVRCSCGTEEWRHLSNLSNKGSKRCRKCGHKKMSETKTGEYSLAWKKDRVFRAVNASRAIKRGLEMTLSIDEVFELAMKDCYYCGLPAEESNTFKGTYNSIRYNGIDRVDNLVGYVQGNVRPCCWVCNNAKKGMTEELFREWVLRIHGKWARLSK